jgi:zinc protease
MTTNDMNTTSSISCLRKVILSGIIVLVFGSGFLAPANAEPNALKLPEGVTRVTSVEGITEYRLANGLQVLLFPDPSQAVITVNVTYKVGSRHEGYGETGMAHLLEHMVFKGTPKHPNIPKEMTERGARSNGTTSFDRTNYYETFDASEENLRWALELESDRMINSFIARKDLETEFSVVRNEFESGENSPFGVLYKRMLSTVFQWHNYGNPTIGEKSDIEGAPIERLQAFYKLYYQPDNATLIVTGKIDPQKTIALVHEFFSPIPKPSRQLIPTYTREPIQDGERLVTLRRPGDVQVLGCMFRTAPASHPDHAAMSVLVNLLTDEPSGRLYKALVESKKAASISGWANGLAEGGIASFWAEVRADQSIADAQAAMLAVFDDLKPNPPTDEEVAKAKTRLLKGIEMSFKQSSHLGLMLSNYIGQGDWRLAFLNRDNLDKVTSADVARVATGYLKSSNRTIGQFLPDSKPDRAEIPEAPDLAALLKDYKGKAPIAQGEDFDASPANIEARTTRGKLVNGMQYALLPKRTRGQSVNATITLRFGTLESLQSKQTIASLTASMLDKGTQTKTRQQLNDLEDALKARIEVSGGVASATVSIETDRDHLADAIRLAGEIMRTPSMPADEFDKLRTETLSNLEQQKTDPQSLAGIAFSRVTSPYPAADPRYTMDADEQIAALNKVTLDQVRAFHKTFYGASNGTAAIVGDFDPAAVGAALRDTFADWKSPSPFQRIPSDYVAVDPVTRVIPTPDKANAIFIAGLGYPMRNDHPDYPSLVIGGYILGGGFLNSRLATRIRQQEGLSYGVGGRFFADTQDLNGGFRASAIYNPSNVDKLDTAFRDVIETAARDGVTEAELTAARDGWLKARKVQRANDAALAGSLSGYLEFGRTLAWDADFESRVEKLTMAEVNAALKKYLDYNKLTFIKAGDFKPADAARSEAK